ncbi:formate/nitrite transporter family protein [Lindgomyces ingoldianus]|uniref:Formate/nitrite transporter family protein n=1 Tax=Lindgomyces ingoldianus TaxID=673940 RepID=A0ACB6QDP4_9PLEO|nr:formate/nitrite transporter family protein [Lindgomyces ingoldianus]KAF2464242.1 formate/nitrite transporter family protein [Lindgomyces ingoldianus]
MVTLGINAYTPQETIELVSRAGVKKGKMRLDKVFLSSVSAGALLSCVAASCLSVNTAPWYQENAPGLIRTMGAFVFPYGLVLIVLTGADLCTGTFMYTTVSVLHRRLSVYNMLLHWFITFWGNLAGSLFIVAIIFGYGEVFSAEPYRTEVHNFVTKKQVTPTFHEIFLRGIGCNWLVCLACFLGMQGRDLASKVLGIWWPIYAFVSLGFDHVVANMFFIPMGIWLETPKLSVGLYVWKGIIPAGLGNIVGGALFCGAYYWYMYILMQPDIPVDGMYYDRVEGIEVKGPRKNSDDEERNEYSYKNHDRRRDVADVPTIGVSTRA